MSKNRLLLDARSFKDSWVVRNVVMGLFIYNIVVERGWRCQLSSFSEEMVDQTDATLQIFQTNLFGFQDLSQFLV